MSTDETPKQSEADAKTKESEIADSMEADMETRDEGRLSGERSQRQDVTQGMDTGTHDSIHRGVDWRPEFSIHSEPKPRPPAAPEDPKDKKD